MQRQRREMCRWITNSVRGVRIGTAVNCIFAEELTWTLTRQYWNVHELWSGVEREQEAVKLGSCKYKQTNDDVRETDLHWHLHGQLLMTIEWKSNRTRPDKPADKTQDNNVQRKDKEEEDKGEWWTKTETPQTELWSVNKYSRSWSLITSFMSLLKEDPDLDIPGLIPRHLPISIWYWFYLPEDTWRLI